MENAYLEYGFGLASLICFTLNLVPQLYKNYQMASTDGLSPSMLLIWFFGTLPQCLYVIKADLSLPIIIQPHMFCALSLGGLLQDIWFDSNHFYWSYLFSLFSCSSINNDSGLVDDCSSSDILRQPRAAMCQEVGIRRDFSATQDRSLSRRTVDTRSTQRRRRKLSTVAPRFSVGSRNVPCSRNGNNPPLLLSDIDEDGLIRDKCVTPRSTRLFRMLIVAAVLSLSWIGFEMFLLVENEPEWVLNCLGTIPLLATIIGYFLQCYHVIKSRNGQSVSILGFGFDAVASVLGIASLSFKPFPFEYYTCAYYIGCMSCDLTLIFLGLFCRGGDIEDDYDELNEESAPTHFPDQSVDNSVY